MHLVINELQLMLINGIIFHSNFNHIPFTPTEVEIVLKKYIKTGKGMDINYHITEQYKFGGPSLYKAIADFWNQSYLNRIIPISIKKSLVFFSLKPNKDAINPNNYRTISQVTKMYEIGELLMWHRTKH